MALLRVLFPHDDEQGNRWLSGDYREIPDHLVEFYTAVDLTYKVPLMDIDETVWKKDPKVESVYTPPEHYQDQGLILGQVNEIIHEEIEEEPTVKPKKKK